MNIETATPETATVDAPASMEDIISEIAGGEAAPADVEREVVQELVEEAEGGDAEQSEAAEDDATEATEEAVEAAEEEPEAQDEPEPAYTVKVNGNEVEVPLSELLKGYSREQDYTAKTMALAEERKSLSSQFANELEQRLEVFKASDPILAEADQIDWQRLSQDDPTTYVQLKAAVDERRKIVTDTEARIAKAREGQAEAEAAKAREIAEAETKRLIEAVPELKDTTALTSFATNAVNYLRGTGYDDGEIAELTDHRALIIVDKARRFDELQMARSTLPPKKVVPKSQAKALKTDGSSGSPAAKPRFPGTAAPRDRQLGWVVDQLLSEKG